MRRFSRAPLCGLDGGLGGVELEPEPEPGGLTGLLALAERDCFVGSSLTAKPTYRWTVNGRTIAP